MLKNKKIFITGGAGFIASHICDKLADNNKIVSYDNYTRNAIRFDEKLQQHPNFTALTGDVLEFDHLTESMKDADIVIHCAAVAGIYSVGKNPTMTMKINFLGTYHTLEAAVKNKVKRFIDFSTSEVYGPFVYRGKESDSTTLGPVGEKRWVYAVSKLAGEHFAHTYHDEYDMEVVTIRPFNVYGPRQVGEGAIQQITRRALKNEDIIVYNDGTQIRAWCFVSDFVNALYNALYVPEAAGEVFNIGNPQATITVLRLAEKIIEMTNSQSRIIFKEHPGAEVSMRVPEIEKAINFLQYFPEISLEEGLKRSINWYKEHLED
jgi:nucleoside-diphosphate-sugar epimerase